MMKPLPNYLPMYRKRGGFSQIELGRLLGHKDGSNVCEYEAGIVIPSEKNMATLEIIFGVSRQEIFPGYCFVEPDPIKACISSFLQQLQRQPRTSWNLQKVTTLNKILGRLELFGGMKPNYGNVSKD